MKKQSLYKVIVEVRLSVVFNKVVSYTFDVVADSFADAQHIAECYADKEYKGKIAKAKSIEFQRTVISR